MGLSHLAPLNNVICRQRPTLSTFRRLRGCFATLPEVEAAIRRASSGNSSALPGCAPQRARKLGPEPSSQHPRTLAPGKPKQARASRAPRASAPNSCHPSNMSPLRLHCFRPLREKSPPTPFLHPPSALPRHATVFNARENWISWLLLASLSRL